ncbi:S9 family peptidase [Ramlibacter sp. XY19]|uniref:alpha/beta hydrolase family protein n=1 Tax=Ramlibacter paludis TaxID=2908000 RepID=UPI0023DA0056|nr:S9 family peptidase [Ramlibacter paludis]MCG2592369.1 S9 family peptidase [Ramlibacter paludis]
MPAVHASGKALARWAHLAFITVFLAWSQPTWSQTTPIPLNDFLVPPRISSMTLSPDGKWVAGIGQAGAQTAAFLLELSTSRPVALARWQRDSSYLYGVWPVAVHWIGNDLLAVDYSNNESVSVDLTGKRVAALGERFIRRMLEKGASSDWVLAYRDVEDGDIDAVNARTGERRKYRLSLPGKLLSWAFDASGALRAVTTMDTAFWAEKTEVSNWYRTSEDAPWQLLEETPVTGDYWVPMRVLPEPDTLAVYSRHGRDTYAVFRYDAAKRQHVEVMAGHPTEDIVGVTGLDQPNFDKVVTAGIKPQITWFEQRWAALQASVDAALPGRINVLEGDKNGLVLIMSYGDVDPGHWYLLDTKTSKMRELGAARPNIDPKRMRPMETVSYKARDGMIVQGYLTRPAQAGDKPAPTVVLIHGGPQLRDRWMWNDEVQLLASRGYAVFQPQFRGSAGFGRRFEEAGYRQWGRAMQDDITDGVDYLVTGKVSDPQRICISGASYGGYAALWGVIKTPGLYKCGISFAGVSDLGEMLGHSIFDDSTAASRELMRAHIGDAAQARRELDEVSPVRHAAQVQVPLLIAHGEEDTRVFSSQSKNMVKALKAQGKSVEWMPMEKVGHGFFWVRDEARYLTAVLNFLDRHIGDGKQAADDAKSKLAEPPEAKSKIE